MTKKQKKTLLRILIAAVMLVALHFIPVTGWLRLALYLAAYLVIGYDIMKKETGRFTYYNAQTNKFYYLLDETLYEVSLADMTQTAIVEGIPSAKYLVSANRRLVAYPNNAEDEQVTAITIQNFETGETYEKTCASGDLLLALGFVENARRRIEHGRKALS